MGLLDSVMGALGNAPTAADGRPGGDALQALIAMLAQGGGGGLGGLVQQFQHAGLGEVIGSWIGGGQNLPVSPDQIQGALGDGMLSRFAQQLGVSQGDAAMQLSNLLPQVVDRLTPQGQLPSAGAGLGDIGSLLERFSQPR